MGAGVFIDENRTIFAYGKDGFVLIQAEALAAVFWYIRNRAEWGLAIKCHVAGQRYVLQAVGGTSRVC